MAVDTPDVSAQREVLHIRTELSPPYPYLDHPQAAELAALRRVRSLIDTQIQAMAVSVMMRRWAANSA
jgi:hypothetical protein